MKDDKQLKEILNMAVNNAVSRIKVLRSPADRRCVFNEYKEWLGENINDVVLAIPTEIIQNELDTWISLYSSRNISTSERYKKLKK